MRLLCTHTALSLRHMGTSDTAQRGCGEHYATQMTLQVILTCSKGGGGCFPRQKLDSVQVALRSMESLVLSLSCSRRGARAPLSSTRSLHWAESPAMFPRAQTACIKASRVRGQHSTTLTRAYHCSIQSLPGKQPRHMFDRIETGGHGDVLNREIQAATCVQGLHVEACAGISLVNSKRAGHG